MTSKRNSIPLDRLNSGQSVRIHYLPEGDFRARFIRLGIHEGEQVRCLERLPGGTVVLQKNRQQIAIGHQLARQILVVAADDAAR
ncbi:MAG: ferrous iron transport protein A [Candidatus Eisenbacteria bacterium]|nr:ferrous iron transport protein A [Candidatus Eisenbacteria bacterium]